MVYLTLDSKHPIIGRPADKVADEQSWRSEGPPPETGTLALVPARRRSRRCRGRGHSHLQRQRAGQGERALPAIICSEYGQGRVVYFPASIDKGMFFYPDTTCGR